MIGLGYVGLPLAIAYAEKYPIIGFDINQSRIDELEAGIDRTLEVEDELLATVKSNIACMTDVQKAKDCDTYIVTVPTLIFDHKRPDLIPHIKSCKAVGKLLSMSPLNQQSIQVLAVIAGRAAD